MADPDICDLCAKPIPTGASVLFHEGKVHHLHCSNGSPELPAPAGPVAFPLGNTDPTPLPRP